MNGVFWNDDTGFVVDPQSLPSRFPHGMEFRELEFAGRLLESGALPELSGAPVASWVLARLFALPGERLGFEARCRLRNDGGGFHLNWVAFDRSLCPAAFFDLAGYPTAVWLYGGCSPLFDSESVVAAFTNSLTSEPLVLTPCRVEIVDTDPPEAPGKFGRTFVYGWDGGRFLGDDSE
jgi:hypothetical protein